MKKAKKNLSFIFQKIADETEEILCWYCETIYGDPNDPLLDDD